MEATIVGVFPFESVTLVHVISREADKDGNYKTDKVFVKNSSEKITQCVLGANCVVGIYRYNDKTYNYITF